MAGLKGQQNRFPENLICLAATPQALDPEPEEGQQEMERPPRGGFTDVGQHTGGTARDTAWPLVREAFKVRCVRGARASRLCLGPHCAPHHVACLPHRRRRGCLLPHLAHPCRPVAGGAATLHGLQRH